MEAPLEPEEWMIALKIEVEKGRYKTEAALDRQERFPWQDKTCSNCKWWLDTGWCEVFAADYAPGNHTCSYYDEPNHAAAQAIIEDRMAQSRKRYWEWLAKRNNQQGKAS